MYVRDGTSKAGAGREKVHPTKHTRHGRARAKHGAGATLEVRGTGVEAEFKTITITITTIPLVTGATLEVAR